MNSVSSRSHTILTVYISQKISPSEYMHSTLSLIDLAGSERVKKTNSMYIYFITLGMLGSKRQSLSIPLFQHLEM